jgi:hypothetical protein
LEKEGNSVQEEDGEEEEEKEGNSVQEEEKEKEVGFATWAAAAGVCPSLVVKRTQRLVFTLKFETFNFTRDVPNNQTMTVEFFFLFDRKVYFFSYTLSGGLEARGSIQAAKQ